MTPNHLVVVCGHGIWLGGPQRGHDESEWLIEAYKAGETPTFVAHIRAGVQVLADDPRAVVVFSGGRTRRETALSEGQSYANLAAAHGYFGLLDGAAAASTGRVLVDDQALDSYYNILFGLVAFWRAHAAWPARLTLVSHAFKRARLVDGHCAALGFPPERVRFVGINPPNLPAAFGGGATSETTKSAAMQDAHTIVDDWAVDPHGIGPRLAGKRRARNPWQTSQHLFASDAERQRSGLATRMIDDMEALADDSPRPWE